MTKIPSDDILESLYKLRIRASEQLKTVSELYDMEIHQNVSMPNYQKLKTMLNRSTDRKLRLRNFDARHQKIETGAVVKSHKGLSIDPTLRGKERYTSWRASREHRETTNLSCSSHCHLEPISNMFDFQRVTARDWMGRGLLRTQ